MKDIKLDFEDIKKDFVRHTLLKVEVDFDKKIGFMVDATKFCKLVVASSTIVTFLRRVVKVKFDKKTEYENQIRLAQTFYLNTILLSTFNFYYFHFKRLKIKFEVAKFTFTFGKAVGII